MPSYDIHGIDKGFDAIQRKAFSQAEDIENTRDDPNRNEQDMFQDTMMFTNTLDQKNLGQRVMLAALKHSFTVDETIMQEVK
jgi:hypothetical protein